MGRRSGTTGWALPTITVDLTYHSPTDEQKLAYIEIRTAAIHLAHVIDRMCPGSPDRTAAMRKLRECVMTANASIATEGGHYR